MSEILLTNILGSVQEVLSDIVQYPKSRLEPFYPIIPPAPANPLTGMDGWYAKTSAEIYTFNITSVNAVLCIKFKVFVNIL